MPAALLMAVLLVIKSVVNRWQDAGRKPPDVARQTTGIGTILGPQTILKSPSSLRESVEELINGIDEYFLQAPMMRP